jgi:hypothetical protein
MSHGLIDTSERQDREPSTYRHEQVIRHHQVPGHLSIPQLFPTSIQVSSGGPHGILTYQGHSFVASLRESGPTSSRLKGCAVWGRV